MNSKGTEPNKNPSNFFTEQMWSDIIISNKKQNNFNPQESQNKSIFSKFSNSVPNNLSSNSKVLQYLNKDLIEEIDQSTPINFPNIPPFNKSFTASNKKNFCYNIASQKKKKNKKKKFVEREGDWTCFECKNLNFSFRKQCNRCFESKEYSDRKHDDFINNVLKIINLNEKKRKEGE